jgi:hypothetical protein
MGFFDNWSVSGITTDEAKQSEKFYILAQTICYNEDCGVSEDYLIMTSNLLKNLKYDFDSFFLRNNTSNKNNPTLYTISVAFINIREAEAEPSLDLINKAPHT